MILEIDRRLQEWARWRCGVSDSMRASSKIYDMRGRAESTDNISRESIVPVDEIECADTHRCVMALEPVLRQAVEEAYLRMGGCSYESVAVELGISRTTLWRRIDVAHRLIMGWLNDLSGGIAVEPWRMEEPTNGH